MMKDHVTLPDRLDKIQRLALRLFATLLGLAAFMLQLVDPAQTTNALVTMFGVVIAVALGGYWCYQLDKELYEYAEDQDPV